MVNLPRHWTNPSLDAEAPARLPSASQPRRRVGAPRTNTAAHALKSKDRHKG